MIIGLTGFHSCGKSVLADFLVQRFGWRRVVKRLLLKEWSGAGEDESLWTAWYRDLYQKMDSREIMHHLLGQIKYDPLAREVILLDAVHSHGEWQAIKEADPTSLLVGIFIPQSIRLQRSSQEDLTLDAKRKRFWHSDNGQNCLLSEIEWSFSGTAGDALRALEAQGLFDHLKAAGKID